MENNFICLAYKLADKLVATDSFRAESNDPKTLLEQKENNLNCRIILIQLLISIKNESPIYFVFKFKNIFRLLRIQYSYPMIKYLPTQIT